MFLDDEEDIINCIPSAFSSNRFLLFNGNSFTKKVLGFFKHVDEFIADNAHDALPPDFYSERFSCMFDVMRINDTEIKKSYNPVLKRERAIEQTLKSTELCAKNPDARIIINTSSFAENEHTYEKYQKNCRRVLSQHISKIPRWKEHHPNIKYKGLLIYDETECYFDGYVEHDLENQFIFLTQKDKPLVLHEPWKDKSLIEPAYESELDFIVWLCPYKPYGTVCLEYGIDYPEMVIADVRYPNDRFADYTDCHLVSM